MDIKESKIIPYATRYRVFPDGTILSYAKSKKGRPLKHIACENKKRINKQGYPAVDIVDDNKVIKKSLVHRLVAEAFIPNPDNLPCVNHKDGDKHNNNVDNLEWCSYKDNTQHALKNNLLNPPVGERCGSSKHKEKDIASAIDLIVAGKDNTTIGKELGISPDIVSDVRNKTRWKYLWDKMYPNTGIVPGPTGRFESKLSDDERINLLQDLSTMRNADIAKKYNLDPAQVSKIRTSDTTWRALKQKINYKK